MGLEPREVGDFDLSAIDGERKLVRNVRQKEMGGVSYTPPEEPIRSDVLELLKQDEEDFLEWYQPRIDAVEEELERYELICSIPDLAYGSEDQKNDLTSNTQISNHLEVLREAKTYLEALKDKWEELNNQETVKV